MRPTSLSLLDRLKVAQPDAPDWGHLREIYLPLIRRWLGASQGSGTRRATCRRRCFLSSHASFHGSSDGGKDRSALGCEESP